MSNLYRQYLAATAVEKLFKKAEMKYHDIAFNQNGTLRVLSDEWFVTSQYRGEERYRELRKSRERLINVILESVPGAYCDRKKNEVTVYAEIHGVKIEVQAGEALCERVQTGTKTVEKIDPEYLEGAPKITVEEPIYEYHCSDDIMGSMAHKVS